MVKTRGIPVVKVGEAHITDITEVKEAAEDYPSKFATGGRVYEVVYESETVKYGRESISVKESDVDSFVDIMYMTQRSTLSDEWSELPTATADVYDALVFLQFKIKAEKGISAYEDELEDLKSENRYNTDF